MLPSGSNLSQRIFDFIELSQSGLPVFLICLVTPTYSFIVYFLFCTFEIIEQRNSPLLTTGLQTADEGLYLTVPHIKKTSNVQKVGVQFPSWGQGISQFFRLLPSTKRDLLTTGGSDIKMSATSHRNSLDFGQFSIFVGWFYSTVLPPYRSHAVQCPQCADVISTWCQHVMALHPILTESPRLPYQHDDEPGNPNRRALGLPDPP